MWSSFLAAPLMCRIVPLPYAAALMLPCQLLKPDKLSIFSVASQKAANSPATKLLISRVSFAALRVLCSSETWPTFLLCSSVSLCFLLRYLGKKKNKTHLLGGNQVANLQVSWKSCLLHKAGPGTSERAAITASNP